jgi:predicted DNA binding CopG/RHH family protein
VRWNLHLSEQLRTCIKAKAEARGLQDSQMVEELLWLALALMEEESSTKGVG